MRTMFLALGALSMAVPTAVAFAPTKAEAKSYSYRDGQDRRHKRYKYREWRGRDGRTYCRKPDGTTGLVVGGVAGALVGRTIDTKGDRSMGTLLGAAAGALAGREIERSGKRSCR